MADAYTNIGEKDKGEALLAEALEVARKDDSNILEVEEIAKAHAKAGRIEQAKLIADSAKYRGTRFNVAMQIAETYLDAGQRQKAIETIEPEWQFFKNRKYNLPQAWPDDLRALAVTFARAAQPDKAAEVLLSALQQVRTQDKSSQVGNLFIVALAYATAKLEPNEAARDLLRKICNREPLPVSPEEQAMRRRVEEAADHFIRRWHETLDLNVLFDELYVTDAKQRWINVAWFAGVYQFMTATAGGPAVDKDVDEATLRAGFMAFWNMAYLSQEYGLTHGKRNEPLARPPGVEALIAAMRGVKLDPKRMSRAAVIEFVAKANAVAAAYRPALSPANFQSRLYQSNLKGYEGSQSEDSRGVRILHGFPGYGIPETVEVYRLRRGVFDFYFVEENGKLRVLTLGFEL